MKESRYNVWVEDEQYAYVYNGVSGGLLRTSKRDRVQFRRNPAEVSASLLEDLAHGRMIVPDGADELELLRARYEHTRGDLTQFGLTIVTSLGCNFDCPYCFEAKHPSIMNPEVECAILQVLDDQLPRIRSFNVTWYGGEPLVGIRPLLSLSDAFKERCDSAGVDYAASIVTNGYLLGAETALSLRDRRITSAQITLDGPPRIHDDMRPLAGGGSSFWKIVENIREAAAHLTISIRVNVDKQNFRDGEELLAILRDAGLAGRVSVYAAQLVAPDYGAGEPSATYGRECFRSAEFAKAELEFKSLVRTYGFAQQALPRPTGAPCTAVKKNELVVGSKGELYKCWESVGNPKEVVGHISSYNDRDDRLMKWLRYSPFDDLECRSCIALPVCMGGCAVHAMTAGQYENRCGTFRHTYREQVRDYLAPTVTRPVARRSLPIVEAN